MGEAFLSIDLKNRSHWYFVSNVTVDIFWPFEVWKFLRLPLMKGSLEKFCLKVSRSITWFHPVYPSSVTVELCTVSTQFSLCKFCLNLSLWWVREGSGVCLEIWADWVSWTTRRVLFICFWPAKWVWVLRLIDSMSFFCSLNWILRDSTAFSVLSCLKFRVSSCDLWRDRVFLN